jgi:hypothetical protein
VAVAAGVAISQWLRRPDDPEEIEKRRRFHLNQIGRIVEGHIVELVEVPAQSGESLASKRRAMMPNGNRKMVCYNYSISGVSYETAQDVTGLEERAPLNQLVAGRPASIKYDPSNPSDSIIVADDWSGVR